MSKENEGMPFVPEENLDLHEDFAPIIAENGVIRPKVDPHQVEELTIADTTFTRMDTVQDLVQIRSAEQQAVPQEKPASKPQAAPKQELKEKPSRAQTQTPARQPSNKQEPKEKSFKKTVEPVAKQPKPKMAQTPVPEDSFADLNPVEEVPAEREERVAAPVKKVTPVPSAQASSALPPLKQEQMTVSSQQIAKRPDEKKSQGKVPPTTPPKQPAEQAAAKPKKRRRWVWVLAILCFLFLGTVSGVVPVENIPFLRNLAYAMGFTKDDTTRMSFLRALLTWTDKNIGLPGFMQALIEPRSSWWGGASGDLAENGQEAGSVFSRMQRQSGSSSLIDINKLNAMQREKGYKLDGIRGSVSPIPGNEATPGPTMLSKSEGAVQTEANQKTSDVFFGSDASSVSRNFKDGYDSVNMLKKVSNPHIANGEPIDWLKNMTQRMMKKDKGLGGVDKELRGSQVNWGISTQDVGEDKPHRDLYHAWITSRMSKYTSNLMLKKALADTGFMGAEMPSTASNVLTFGGVQIDTEALQQDQEAWKEYQEWEKKCKEDLNTSGDKIDKARDSFNALFWDDVEGPGHPAPVNLNFPKSCAEMKTANKNDFTKNLVTISSACKTMKLGYESLQKTCSMQVETQLQCSEATFSTSAWSGHFDSFKKYCEEDYCKEQKKIWEAQSHQEGEVWDEAACQAQVLTIKEEDWLAKEGYDAGTTTKDLILDQVGGDSDYFPQLTKDQDYEDDTHNVQNSITNAMGQNKTL